MKVQFINGKNSLQLIGNKVSANNIQSLSSTKQLTTDEVRFSAAPKLTTKEEVQQVNKLLVSLMEPITCKNSVQPTMKYDKFIKKLIDDLNKIILNNNGKYKKFDINEQKFIKALIDLAQETDCTRVSVKKICKKNMISDTFIPALISNMDRTDFIRITTQTINGRNTTHLDLAPEFYKFLKSKGVKIKYILKEGTTKKIKSPSRQKPKIENKTLSKLDQNKTNPLQILDISDTIYTDMFDKFINAGISLNDKQKRMLISLRQRVLINIDKNSPTDKIVISAISKDTKISTDQITSFVQKLIEKGLAHADYSNHQPIYYMNPSLRYILTGLQIPAKKEIISKSDIINGDMFHRFIKAGIELTDDWKVILAYWKNMSFDQKDKRLYTKKTQKETTIGRRVVQHFFDRLVEKGLIQSNAESTFHPNYTRKKEFDLLLYGKSNITYALPKRIKSNIQPNVMKKKETPSKLKRKKTVKTTVHSVPATNTRSEKTESLRQLVIKYEM